jgi:hypothetical protein
LQVPFKQCQSCVYFVDKNEDDTDDQYFENRMTNAPLCSTIWSSKDKCNGKCKRLGSDGTETWNTSDRVLLTVLSIFSKSFAEALGPFESDNKFFANFLLLLSFL